MSTKSFSLLRNFVWFDEHKGYSSPRKPEVSPSLKIQVDKEAYRPGDTVIATIQVSLTKVSEGDLGGEQMNNELPSFLLDNLAFEIKGMEKLDSQWFATQKPIPGSKQRRGETLFLDCRALSLVTKVVLSSGSSKTYPFEIGTAKLNSAKAFLQLVRSAIQDKDVVRFDLPKILPPSYRGIGIRYIYYISSTAWGRWLHLESYNQKSVSNSLIQVEARHPLQIWISQISSNMLFEEGNSVLAGDQLDIYWKEKDADSEWVRANESLDLLEEEYDSSKDEVSSVSSYNPSKGNVDARLRSSFSLQSMASRLSNQDIQYSQAEQSSLPSYLPLTQLSVSEIMDDPSGGLISPQNKLMHSFSSSGSQQRSFEDINPKGVNELPYASKPERSVSEGFIRGRSYNIRIDDQVLLRFSPRNAGSTYYFGDMIGGTLSFFHEGLRRCLEVSITLEISETVPQHLVHPSRRSSPTITKVHSEHPEVVADLVQTSFMFSIPIDGPMSFSTPKVSVQWSLRFEFFTTPEGVDLSRYEHPLLIEQKERGDWVLPITVYPPPRTQANQSMNEKSSSLGSLLHT